MNLPVKDHYEGRQNRIVLAYIGVCIGKTCGTFVAMVEETKRQPLSTLKYIYAIDLHMAPFLGVVVVFKNATNRQKQQPTTTRTSKYIRRYVCVLGTDEATVT